jgi:CMP-2-keto-3-deoxyoctulosonic acid synthetase
VAQLRNELQELRQQQDLLEKQSVVTERQVVKDAKKLLGVEGELEQRDDKVRLLVSELHREREALRYTRTYTQSHAHTRTHTHTHTHTQTHTHIGLYGWRCKRRPLNQHALCRL